jgi:hypothetical protein
MTQTIDLQSFCSIDSNRMDKPFSIGEYTYATNGHISIRVPRDPSVDEIDNPVAIEKAFASFNSEGMRPLKNAIPDAPKAKQERCVLCLGTGIEHDCPECKHSCGECDGAGWTTEIIKESVMIDGKFFDASFIRKISILPFLIINLHQQYEGAMGFQFDGGFGLVMPLRGKRKINLDVEL